MSDSPKLHIVHSNIAKALFQQKPTALTFKKACGIIFISNYFRELFA